MPAQTMQVIDGQALFLSFFKELKPSYFSKVLLRNVLVSFPSCTKCGGDGGGGREGERALKMREVGRRNLN